MPIHIKLHLIEVYILTIIQYPVIPLYSNIKQIKNFEVAKGSEQSPEVYLWSKKHIHPQHSKNALSTKLETSKYNSPQQSWRRTHKDKKYSWTCGKIETQAVNV